MTDSGDRLPGRDAFEATARDVGTIPAAGGLWTTADDLVRFGSGWDSLLPGGLAREALRPQVARDADGGQIVT